jgi:hypothetical protein
MNDKPKPPNRPLQLTGPAPACGIQRFEGPAPQLNVMYVGQRRDEDTLKEDDG